MGAAEQRPRWLWWCALIFAIGIAAMDAVILAGMQPFDPLVAVGLLLMSAGVASMVLYGGWTAAARRPRGPAGALASSVIETPGLVPFLWRGRSWRRVRASALFALVFVILGMGVALADRWTTELMGPAWRALFYVLLTLMLAMLAFSIAEGMREKTLLIDGSGVHMHGRFRGNFDMAWGDIRQIGVAAEISDPHSLSPPLSVPHIIMLRGKDGRPKRTLNPRVELSPELEGAVLGTLRGFAGRYGIPMREVPFRDFLPWRPRYPH